MRQQKGLSVIAVLLVLALVGFALLLVFKVVPVYSEYGDVKSSLSALSTETNVGEHTLRQEFDAKASVAGIVSIKGDNLIVVAGGNGNYLRAQYHREVPLFGNVSLLFNFDTQAGQPPAQ
ncbi:DUF4845 domain-containing protein [Chromobacterium subtsugae]|uniref:DUF4845 domain-containing protein n=1 Tax=Chromobacterium subtsugae TaxID=251747 RepID=A0ABS7FF14_9NEIS|nr:MULTISPECIES: DUF4845 domain-containing protein [Chromobacterium]KUM03468.1 hypothetical protein Cv017_19040 [Chromobacterium subtsugae]KZE87612.1 hypothetical protein AWB61_10530 [Chromobacterium sp. F49]MBW7567015.1 DUF4845 domain-containing protein [Chromobacterium subtsugae]MBW8288666.1 DUF4845 domain-containing protein [Chromobacterium subtsugae]OBU85797.1 hypothetical protein MY55_14510 [Chromobacterium subtsugae]